MTNPVFDAGIFLCLLSVGFILLLSYQKIGGIVLIGSTICFLILAMLILTGYDVSSTTITTEGNATPIYQTTYFIGNGFAPTGTGQLVMGWVMVILCILSASLLLDSALKGQFFPK